MKIINLVEDTKGNSDCEYAHGLSFYIETAKHRLLMDLGPSDITLRNAKKLGIDLAGVDTVILSHGHYDHSGGIIPFTKINDKAAIYLQKGADGDHYADDGADKGKARYRYIGIDKEIMELPQVKELEGDNVIDDELSVFTIKTRTHKLPSTNSKLLLLCEETYQKDDFLHEQFLVVRENGVSVLISGCAHNGILSILDEYRKLYGSDPDYVLSGFHLMKKTAYTDAEIEEIIDMAKELNKYSTRFLTCHCTGVPVYKLMKKYMGGRLTYIHSGDEIRPVKTVDMTKTVKAKTKERSSYMKWHKFFAWGTVVCFVMTMITGYKRK